VNSAIVGQSGWDLSSSSRTAADLDRFAARYAQELSKHLRRFGASWGTAGPLTMQLCGRHDEEAVTHVPEAATGEVLLGDS
jgi:hypothetical protein